MSNSSRFEAPVVIFFVLLLILGVTLMNKKDPLPKPIATNNLSAIDSHDPPSKKALIQELALYLRSEKRSSHSKVIVEQISVPVTDGQIKQKDVFTFSLGKQDLMLAKDLPLELIGFQGFFIGDAVEHGIKIRHQCIVNEKAIPAGGSIDFVTTTRHQVQIKLYKAVSLSTGNHTVHLRTGMQEMSMNRSLQFKQTHLRVRYKGKELSFPCKHLFPTITR